jgi:hypothetical protein
VGRRCQAVDVVDTIEELLMRYPVPTHLRMDSSSEFIAHALQDCCTGSGSGTAYIEPGSPWENPSAALLIAVGDNPERLPSEAAFAALCGACPIPASSGNRTRHRLNRGVNLQANCALFRIALSRLRWDPVIKAYAQKRSGEGKRQREILRCLKRFLAREVHRLLSSHPSETSATC